MGWWRQDDGVIGDPVADYMDNLSDLLGGIPWQTPADIPAEVLEHMTALYVQDLGREPTDADLAALLAFTQDSK